MKMFLEIFFTTIAVIILIYLFFYYAPALLAPNSLQNSLGFVCINNNCFQVELARTQAEIEKGLMYRKELAKDKGMLFIFGKEGIHPFWMKNTLIPLDIIWINDKKEVVFISQNVQPCKSLLCSSIIPNAKAKYVLEINAGIIKNNGIEIGDLVKITPSL